jgi:hypothetical protein
MIELEPRVSTTVDVVRIDVKTIEPITDHTNHKSAVHVVDFVI